MQCKHCRIQVEDDALFCPMCGAPTEPGSPDEVDLSGLDNAPDADADFRHLADQLDLMEAQSPAYEDEAPYEPAPYAYQPQPEPYAYQPQPEPYAYQDQPAPAPEPQPQAQPANDYADAYQYPEGAQQQQQTPVRFDDGYVVQPEPPAGKYKKTSAGKRIGSIFLCILMAVLLLYVAINVSLRLTLTKDNIREATTVDKMLDQKLITDHGEKTAMQYIDELIGDDDPEDAAATEDVIRTVLRHGRLSDLTALLLTDYTEYLLNDVEPTYLNADYIISEADRFNEDLSDVAGVQIVAFDTSALKNEINGGDLSFLSIDGDGGYFYRHYHLNPRLPATFLSLPILIICGVIVVLCIVMLFAINSSNLPAGLRFNGVVLIVIGSIAGLTAIGCLILTFIAKFWIITDLLWQMVLWSGVIGGGLLLIGVVMMIVAGVLSRRAAAAAKAAA